MYRRTRKEYQDSGAEKQKETDDQVHEFKETQSDAEASMEKFNDIAGQPILIQETADELNALSDQLGREISEAGQEGKEKVDDLVGKEQTEVSEPAREAESEARDIAEDLDAASRNSERFGERLGDAATVRRQEEGFFKETAEDSERHQGEADERSRELQADMDSTAGSRRKL